MREVQQAVPVARYTTIYTKTVYLYSYSSLSLNPHVYFHCVVVDGVFESGTGGQLPVRGFADLEVARTWGLEFVPWYNGEHRHSSIRYVTPARWSGNTRDWSPIGDVTLRVSGILCKRGLG